MASGLEREAKGYSESTYKTDKCASPSANKSGRGPGAGLELALLGLGKGEIGTFMMGVLAELRKHLLSMAAVAAVAMVVSMWKHVCIENRS